MWQQMPHLISISLQNSTSISDQGLAALAKLKPLKSLNLKGCRDISDEGMAALTTLQQLTFLRIQVWLPLTPHLANFSQTPSKRCKFRQGTRLCHVKVRATPEKAAFTAKEHHWNLTGLKDPL